MHVVRRIRFCAVALLLIPGTVLAQDTYKAAVANGLPSSGDVPAQVLSALQSSGATFADGQGSTLAELWLAKTIPAAANPSSESDILYSSIPPGALVGAIHFEKSTTDFRGQPIKAGYYTLRYELVPQDGNHMGVSEYRDFLLLIPASLDADPSKTLGFKQVVQMSSKATSTGHAAVLTMAPAQSKGNSPAAFQDDQQHWALEAESRSGSKDLPLAVVLVGESDAAKM